MALFPDPYKDLRRGPMFGFDDDENRPGYWDYAAVITKWVIISVVVVLLVGLLISAEIVDHCMTSMTSVC